MPPISKTDEPRSLDFGGSPATTNWFAFHCTKGGVDGQVVGQEALEALTTTITRDFQDAETLRAALETLLVVFMYEDHPVHAHGGSCPLT